MKKLILLLFSLSFIYGQTTDMIIYHEADKLGFYDYPGKTDYPMLIPAGPTANQIGEYGDWAFVVNSGVWGAGTNLQIIDKNDLKYLADHRDVNPLLFEGIVRTVPLAENGNAYTATGFGENKLLVTIAQNSALEIIDLSTGTSEALITEGITGNPQGSVAVNDTLIAVAIADWFGAGTGEVAIFNTEQMAVTAHYPTHQNAVDVKLLPDGNLFVWTWGTWSGENNFGTAEIINPLDGSKLYADTLYYDGNTGDKISAVYILSDSTLFYKTFGEKTDLLNFISLTRQSDIQDAWYTAVAIQGQTLEGNFITFNGENTEILAPDGRLLTILPDFYTGTPNAAVSLPDIQTPPYDPKVHNHGLIYAKGNDIGIYDFTGNQNLNALFTSGEMPNKLIASGENLLIINSGSYGAGNNLEKVPLGYFKLAAEGQNVDWESAVIRLDLAENGNAWSGAMVNDSILMVTLPQTRQLQKININTMQILQTYNDTPGHPQGIVSVNDSVVAIAMADWSFLSNYHEGRSVAFFNLNADSITKETYVHLNAVDLIRLRNGNLFGWSSGSWSGEDNFGAYYLIDGETFEILHADSLGESQKTAGTVELEDNVLFMEISDYAAETTFHLVLDAETFTVIDTITGPFYLNGLLRDRYMVIEDESETIIVSARGDSVGSFAYLGLGPYAPAPVAVLYPDSFYTDIREEDELPVHFALEQNYPNPFNPVTTIRFSLASDARIHLEIFNILGQKVTSLAEGPARAGYHEIVWNASQQPSGLYFVRLTVNGKNLVRKMMLVK